METRHSWMTPSIRGGGILDGSGTETVRGDLATRDGRIVASPTATNAVSVGFMVGDRSCFSDLGGVPRSRSEPAPRRRRTTRSLKARADGGMPYIMWVPLPWPVSIPPPPAPPLPPTLLFDGVVVCDDGPVMLDPVPDDEQPPIHIAANTAITISHMGHLPRRRSC